ncbi:MAG TPA: DinB family protein [Candidatus Sulfotelmatobacter sp.]|jgi:hypothetical protein|nr:DinB family protein [Candidatus Sulfotelmatobacter sp.]
MLELDKTLGSVLSERYSQNASRINELTAPLTDAQFWHKPFPYGNSFGHLILHLTGNLNYYIGAQIAKTGYVRDRPREFGEASPPSKVETLKRFDEAVDLVLRTVRAQLPEDWSADYSATGTPAKNRLDILLTCAARMQHHIGQMIYLGYELARQAGTG